MRASSRMPVWRMSTWHGSARRACSTARKSTRSSRLEVEDRLVALEQVFHRHRMHVLVRLGGHLLEDGQRLVAEPLHLASALHVLGRGDALHGLERRLQLLHLVFVDLEDVTCGMTELDAARGEHYHVVMRYEYPDHAGRTTACAD